MDLYLKIKQNIDFNNHYTINKALSLINCEFEKALKCNKNNCSIIIDALNKICDDFETFCDKNNSTVISIMYDKKAMKDKIHKYIIYLQHKTKQ